MLDKYVKRLDKFPVLLTLGLTMPEELYKVLSKAEPITRIDHLGNVRRSVPEIYVDVENNDPAELIEIAKEILIKRKLHKRFFRGKYFSQTKEEILL